MRLWARCAAVTAVSVLAVGVAGCTAGSDEAERPRTSGTPAGAQRPGEWAAETDGLKAGESAAFPARSAGLKVRVDDITYRDRQRVRIRLTVRNTGTKNPVAFSAASVTWRAPRIAEQSATEPAGTDELAKLSKNLWPGQSVTGDVPLTVGAQEGVVSFYDAADGENPAFEVALPTP